MRTLVFLAIFIGGCTDVLRETNPMPKIARAHSSASMALSLDVDVPDAFELTPLHTDMFGAGRVRVTRWRETLSRGFANGIAPVYEHAASPDQTLVIHAAEAHRNFSKVQIRLLADLVDKQGRSLRHWDQIVVSRIIDEPTSPYPVALNHCVADAVAAMYEAIAKDL